MKKKIISEAFETEITELVQSIVKDCNKEIDKKDIKSIMKQLLPDIDEVISKQVKRHLVEIAEYILDNFNEKE